MTSTLREESSTASSTSSTSPPVLGKSDQRRRNKDIAERHKTIEVLFQEIYNYDDIERHASVSIAENIRKLALEFEEIMLQKEQPEFIRTICTLICHRFKDDKRSWLTRYVVRVLDRKYKTFFTEESYRQSQHTYGDLPEECSVEENDAIGQLQLMKEKLNLYQLSKPAIQKMHDMLGDVMVRVEVHAHANSIAVCNIHENKSRIDEINSEANKQYENKISEIPLPIPLDAAIKAVDAEAFDSTIKLAKVIIAWAEKQRDYSRSQTLNDAIRWRDSITAVTMLIQQYVDGKARRSYNQWGQILKTMAEHGGTAASSKSAFPVTDPITGLPMVDPRTLQKLMRDITKEQIDARGPKYAEEIDFMVRQPTLTDMMEERYIILTCGSRNYRALSAREKLSRQA